VRPFKSYFEPFITFCRNSVGPKISPAMGWIIVIYLAATMLFQYDKDTSDISGAAFVVASILAGLAFTYGGVISDSNDDKNDVIYGGERLLQGALLFLAASLLKYGTIAIPAQLVRLALVSQPVPSLEIFVLGLQAILFLVFLNALLVSQVGYTILGRVAMKRMARRGKDVYFPPPQA
jgi:hypothetical protein